MAAVASPGCGRLLRFSFHSGIFPASVAWCCSRAITCFFLSLPLALIDDAKHFEKALDVIQRFTHQSRSSDSNPNVHFQADDVRLRRNISASSLGAADKNNLRLEC